MKTNNETVVTTTNIIVDRPSTTQPSSKTSGRPPIRPILPISNWTYNEEPGAVWLQRLLTVYHNTVWLNPQPEELWDYHESIRLTRELMGERMFPLPTDGLDRGMRLLSKAH